MFKAKVVRLFAVALALAGFLGAAYFTASVWQDRIPFFPALDIEAWLPAHPAVTWLLERVRIGGLLAALCALIAAAGILIAMRQTAMLRAEKRRMEDRLRRVQQYRSDEAQQQTYDSRLEPFIGSGAGTSGTDRRVA